MSSSEKRGISLLICMCVCMAPISCKPRGIDKRPKESKSEFPDVEVDVGKDGLSKAEIVEAAGRAARQMDLDPKKCDVLYDEGNRLWRNAFPKLVADLEGHDYQAVQYQRRQSVPTPGEPVWVLIDRTTGDVLKTVVGERELPQKY